MSERGSFVTEYIYNESDYKIIRKALDKNSKYLCISPPAYWDYKENEMPIVSGKVGESACGMEWLTIASALVGVKTEYDIRIVIMEDIGDILLLIKTSAGDISVYQLETGEEAFTMMERWQL